MNHAHPRFALVACGAGVLLAALLPLTAHAVDLTVEVKGVGVEKGNVMVALYKQTDTWMRKPSMVQMQAGKKEGVSLMFKPRNGSWTGVSVRFCGFLARRDDDADLHSARRSNTA